jgi:hypothetical protein
VVDLHRTEPWCLVGGSMLAGQRAASAGGARDNETRAVCGGADKAGGTGLPSEAVPTVPTLLARGCCPVLQPSRGSCSGCNSVSGRGRKCRLLCVLCSGSAHCGRRWQSGCTSTQDRSSTVLMAPSCGGCCRRSWRVPWTVTFTLPRLFPHPRCSQLSHTARNSWCWTASLLFCTCDKVCPAPPLSLFHSPSSTSPAPFDADPSTCPQPPPRLCVMVSSARPFRLALPPHASTLPRAALSFLMQVFPPQQQLVSSTASLCWCSQDWFASACLPKGGYTEEVEE